MEGDIVKAAKVFGICIIIASLVLVAGLHISAASNCERLSSALKVAGSNARSHADLSVPSTLNLNLRSSGPFQVDLSPNNKEVRLAPVKLQMALPGQ